MKLLKLTLLLILAALVVLVGYYTAEYFKPSYIDGTIGKV